jgi:hypothetical protein
VEENRDVLGKADALLKRHAAAPEAEAGTIPVLTDLIEPPSPLAADSVAGELSNEVFARVMEEVEGRLAAELERRLCQHLEAEVHVAVASALGDLRQDVANAIGDAVTEALRRRQPK